MKKFKLSREEQDLEDRIFSENWQSENRLKQNVYQEAAREQLTKEKKINIRLTANDYNMIKTKANDEGLPYQSLISSLIHKYVKNELVDRRQIKILLNELQII